MTILNPAKDKLLQRIKVLSYHVIYPHNIVGSSENSSIFDHFFKKKDKKLDKKWIR